MKTSIGSRWISWRTSRPYLTHLTCLTYLTALALLLAGCSQESSFSPGEASAAAAEPTSPASSASVEPADQPSADADPEESLAQAEEQSLSTAPVKKVSTEIEVPANLKPSAATAEIIKLANAGTDENLMLAFVTNSTGTFNLRAEEIIYLNDIGVPSRVVTAMIQRDHLLQGASANLTTTPSEPELEPAPAYPPQQPFMAAEPPSTIFDSTPDYSSGNYAAPVDAEPSPTDYTDYYDSLAPYGNWVDVGGEGRCWQPTVAIVDTGWRPYFNCGRWVYTDCGWYWMSGYSWGWAPFHYGRWFQHATLGWCWRPDRIWGPSWVCWRQSGDFCGWAPLPPGARFVAGIGLTFRGHPARHNFSFGLAANHFRFIPASHFLDRDFSRHVLPRDHANRIFEHSIASTGIIDHNHRVSNNGVPRDHIASATRTRIIPATLHNVTPTEGIAIRDRFERNGRTLAVYRPDLEQRIPSRPSTSARDNPALPNRVASRPTIQNHNRFAGTQPGPSQPGQPSVATTARTDTPVRTGQPLILRGPDNPGQTAAATPPASQNIRRAVPLNSLVNQHRDSRVAATQPDIRDTRSTWNSRNNSAPSYNRNFRDSSSQPMARNDDYRSGTPQSSRQPYWWAQPQQRIPDQSQFRHNREIPNRAGGGWNATVESPRYNPSPIHVPEYNRPAPMETHQSRPAPIESRPMHTAPVESHQSHSAPVETHQSHSAPVESHSAPAPAPSSSSSSSHSSSSQSSQSSGRGR